MQPTVWADCPEEWAFFILSNKNLLFLNQRGDLS
ncbi:unknown [Clostridium sp. CAG:230]|nr:unknown [Clostridium sp. CAG:230]